MKTKEGKPSEKFMRFLKDQSLEAIAEMLIETETENVNLRKRIVENELKVKPMQESHLITPLM